MNFHINLRRKIISVVLAILTRIGQALFLFPGAIIGSVLTVFGFLDADFAKGLAETLVQIGHEDAEAVAKIFRAWEPFFWATVDVSALMHLTALGWRRYLGLDDHGDYSAVVLRIDPKLNQEPTFVAPKEIRAGDYFRVVGIKDIGELQRATRDAYEAPDPKNKESMRWNIDSEAFGKLRWPEPEQTTPIN